MASNGMVSTREPTSSSLNELMSTITKSRLISMSPVPSWSTSNLAPWTPSALDPLVPSSGRTTLSSARAALVTTGPKDVRTLGSETYNESDSGLTRVSQTILRVPSSLIKCSTLLGRKPRVPSAFKVYAPQDPTKLRLTLVSRVPNHPLPWWWYWFRHGNFVDLKDS